SEDLGEREPGFKRVEEAPVRQIEVHPHRRAEDLAGPSCLLEPDVGAGGEGCWLTVGEVDDSNPIALAGKSGQRAAAGDFHIVGMSADRDEVQLDVTSFGHARPDPT